MRIAKNTYGGNLAIALDSSNAYPAYVMNQYVNTDSNIRANGGHYFHGGNTDTYIGWPLLFSYTMAVHAARSDLYGFSGGESAGFGQNGDFSTFWNPGDNNAFYFQDEDVYLGNSYIAYIGAGGNYVQTSDERTKFSIRPKVSSEYEYIDRLTQLEPVTYAKDYEFYEEDGKKQRYRKISKMLNIHQGFSAQQVHSVFPKAVHNTADIKRFDFEINETTQALLDEKGITLEEIEKVKEHYADYYANNADLMGIDYSTLTMYTILGVKDFKAMYDEKCEEIEVMKTELQNVKSDLAMIKAQLGIS
jgi:hypothetical protein